MIKLEITEDDYNEILKILGDERDRAQSASLTRRVQEIAALVDRIYQGIRTEGRKTKLMEAEEEVDVSTQIRPKGVK